MPSLLEDAVEDAIVSLKEQNVLLPPELNIDYSPKEWEIVERFHRLQINKDRKVSMSKDRWVFVRMKILGISVCIRPEPEPEPETIH